MQIFIILIFSLQRRKKYLKLEDVVDMVTASDSECDALSSEDELDNETWEPNDESDYSQSESDDPDHADDEHMDVSDPNDVVSLVSIAKPQLEKKQYRFEQWRPFVPLQLPGFIAEPEQPIPEERSPIDYVQMFLTDNMLQNVVFETNKYATEKTGTCPNFMKAELETYIGIYYMMGIIRFAKDWWLLEVWFMICACSWQNGL